MTSIVMVLAAALALSAAAPAPTPDPQRSGAHDGASNSVFQIDISPEEAQKYLNSPPFTSPQLSSRTAVLPLNCGRYPVRWDDPRFRSAEAGPTNGHYWKNGREIENTNDYEEENCGCGRFQVYDAQQFHGQDGLGAYAYGYRAPESSKVENRARSGDVSGAYEFKAGNNDIIKNCLRILNNVRYWADSEGFHQEDNVPRDLPKPPEEPEDIRQARLAHEKAWQEAAAAAAQQPDPQGEYNPGSHQQYQSYQGSASDRRSVSVAPSFRPAPNQLPREGKSYQSYSGQQQLYNQNQPCSNCNSPPPALFGRQGQSDVHDDDPCADCNGVQSAQFGSQHGQNNPCADCSPPPALFGSQQGQSSDHDDDPCAECNGAQPAQFGSHQDQHDNPCLECGNQMQVQLGQQLRQSHGQSSQVQVQLPLQQSSQHQGHQHQGQFGQQGHSNHEQNPCDDCGGQLGHRSQHGQSDQDQDNPCLICDGHQGQASQQQPQYRAPEGQPGQYGQQRQSRQHQGQSGQQRQHQPEEPEPTGPPRGFFYNFNYPVSVIARKGGDQGGQPGQFGRTGRSGQPDNQGQQQQRP